jgi:hypothetical protein
MMALKLMVPGALVVSSAAGDEGSNHAGWVILLKPGGD